MRNLLVLITFLGFAAVAQAQIVFSPAVSYSSTDTDTAGTTASGALLTVDFRLGYVLPSGIYLGGMYVMQDYGQDVLSVDQDGMLIGPTVGYYAMSGFYGLFSYHVVGDLGNRSSGSGMQFDLGWVFPVTSSFALGPQITYKSVKYTKVENAGVTTDQDHTRTDVTPYISLWFMF